MYYKFRMHGSNLVLDVNSGAVHIFDDVAYDVLDFYTDEGEKGNKEFLIELGNKYSKAQIAEAMEDIDYLKTQGLLFTRDCFKELAEGWNSEPVIKALCLHIAHDCNLRCEYCFAAKGDYQGTRSLMSAGVGKKAIDFLIASSGNRHNLEVDFFGGEPLMNFGVVREIVEYARSLEKKHSKNFRFTITTNMLLLDDEKIKYINENMHNIVLSIDGRKEINDLMRRRADGTGCYDKILPVAKKVAESRNQQNYYVRGTFTRHNLDFCSDVLHLADQGFEQISIEPVVAQDGSGYEIRNEDMKAAVREYEKLAYQYYKRRKEGQWFNFFHFMLDLEGGPCVAKRLKGCGSGNEYLAVTPEGDIYPCHQFVGIDSFRMGSVFTGIENNEIGDMFKGTTVYTKPECRDCWAKFYCSGGCTANSWQFHRDLKKSYKIGCELEKKRVECALWIKAQEDLDS